MKLFNLLWSLSLIVFLVACSGKKDKTTEGATTETTAVEGNPYEAMAADLCNCMKPMADLYKKIKELTAAGDVDTLTGLMDELETASEEADECVDALYEKHGEPEDNTKYEDQFRKTCPEVADLISQMEEEE